MDIDWNLFTVVIHFLVKRAFHVQFTGRHHKFFANFYWWLLTWFTWSIHYLTYSQPNRVPIPKDKAQINFDLSQSLGIAHKRSFEHSQFTFYVACHLTSLQQMLSSHNLFHKACLCHQVQAGGWLRLDNVGAVQSKREMHSRPAFSSAVLAGE